MIGLETLFVLIALSAFLVNRIFAATMRWIHTSSWQIKKDYSYQPTVSVLMACFNESSVVYETIVSVMNSNYPKDKLEVVAVDDCSTDDSLVWLRKAEVDFAPRVKVYQTPKNTGGKSGASCFGFPYTTGEVIVETDSDTLFDENTVRELVVPLADPKIGASAGSVRVRNPNASWLAAYQAYTYFLIFELSKIATNKARANVCCSGAMLTIRRSLMEVIEPKLANRYFLGEHVHDGEDRFTTHQVLLMGYGTYHNPDARCWTNVPVTFKDYFNQQLRWRRGALRDFFFTLTCLWKHTKLHPMVMYGYVILPLASLIPLFGAAAMMLGGFPPAYALFPTLIFFCMALVTSMALNKYDPQYPITSSFKLTLATTMWVFHTVFVTTLALFTLNHASWATRDAQPQEIKAS